jgi:hypothetical protein
MIENVMNKMGGIAIFGIMSISLFFIFFTGMLLWASRLKKNYINTMRTLPLDSEDGSADRLSPRAILRTGADEAVSAPLQGHL